MNEFVAFNASPPNKREKTLVDKKQEIIDARLSELKMPFDLFKKSLQELLNKADEITKSYNKESESIITEDKEKLRGVAKTTLHKLLDCLGEWKKIAKTFEVEFSQAQSSVYDKIDMSNDFDRIVKTFVDSTINFNKVFVKQSEALIRMKIATFTLENSVVFEKDVDEIEQLLKKTEAK